MPKPALSQQLRGAIRASGMSQKDICRRLGLHEAQMSRFMAGSEGFGMEALDKLAGMLLEISTAKPRGIFRAKGPFRLTLAKNATTRASKNPVNSRSSVVRPVE